MSMINRSIKLACLASAFALPATALAQDYGRSGEGEDRPNGRVEVTPYIEAAQVLAGELSPGNDSVTYTRLAAGVDANVNGRNTQGGISLRYERRIGYGDDTVDGDYFSGLARVSAALVPRTLTFEAGGLAARSRFEGDNVNPLIPDDDNQTTDIYSVYGGPTLTTNIDKAAVSAAYRVGYTRVEQSDVGSVNNGVIDVFDDSVTHNASASIAMRPGDYLPVGVTVSGGYAQEDISNLDQRVRDAAVRADVTVPVTRSLALVGGIGYEDVEISSRDAVRDINGAPVVDSSGRFVTDKSSPRQIAFETDGLIWDAGVSWRPSRRTALEARVGRRYGGTTYYGTFAYQPNRAQSFNVSVYDRVSGFGGQVNNALAELGTDFQINRNPITGEVSNCVGSLEGGNCLGSVLGGVRSASFRARGVNATFAQQVRNLNLGVGVGYDRRKFVAAQGTVLAAANGIEDETYYATAFANAQLDERSQLNTNLYASWFDSGFDPLGDATIYGANAGYYRNLIAGLEASVAVSVDGISREQLEDIWTASAQLGVRYSF